MLRRQGPRRERACGSLSEEYSDIESEVDSAVRMEKERSRTPPDTRIQDSISTGVRLHSQNHSRNETIDVMRVCRGMKTISMMMTMERDGRHAYPRVYLYILFVHNTKQRISSGHFTQFQYFHHPDGGTAWYYFSHYCAILFR